MSLQEQVAQFAECYWKPEGKSCEDLYNCCDCGGTNCGCPGCWTCNACKVCNPPDVPNYQPDPRQKGSSMLKVPATYNEDGEIGNLREQVRVLREALERVNRECDSTPHEDPHLCHAYDSVTAETVIAVRAALEATKEA